MKKVICIILSVVLFTSGGLICFAADDLVPVEGFTTWDDVSADGKALGEAYINAIKSVGSGDIKQIFKSLSDVPLSYLKMLSDGTLVLSPVDDIYYYLNNGTLYYHNNSGHGGGGGSRPGEGSSGEDSPVTEPSDFYIKSDDLVDYIEEQNTLNTPKGKDLFKQSYQTQTAWFSNYNSQYLPFFNDSSFSQFNDLYFVPFLVDESGVNYFSNFQFHIYYIPVEDDNADIGLMFDIYAYSSDFGYIKQDSNCGFLFELLSGMEPLGICTGPFFKDGLVFGRILNQDNYTKGVASDTFYYTISGLVDFDKYFSSDGVSKKLDDIGIFSSKYSDLPNGVGSRDYGYICSYSFIERTYKDIDTSKILPNQIINITGDTIYDYSITNPDTGASTTINNYVTNNYIYPEVPSTSEPSDGGSGVGGNVNVTGDIGVSGQVDVNIGVSVPDININVNQGSGVGGSGTGINPDDILDGSSVDLDKYYDEAVSQASGVRSFLKQFFDFLPAELLGLICMLVAVAIVCRIFGR